ncbi:ester cyclase (plasmid) [Rhizobium sp. 32-5/1]|uniref:ester cyclase n=1 Tax=Rhizobium sp. 32-5/1 TaxID=3019602 RepID=UPI00240DC67B|nr:ester cyclase [Rhizobium sp. 32-5/1]WEZ85369.1 ester cyclase [Rhizobium sp. 32-5/1]
MAEELIRGFWAAFEKDAASDLENYFTADYVRHSPQADISRREFLTIIRERALAFPDLKTAILDVVEDTAKIAYRWESQGTHLGKFMNVPPTGRTVRVSGITISRLSGGKIAEDWSSWQNSDVLHGMSVFPI